MSRAEQSVASASIEWWRPKHRARRAAESAPNARLEPFQQVGAWLLARLLDAHGCALLADAPGLGKSHTAIAAIRAIDARAVVVVPAALRTQWSALLSERGLDWRVLSHGLLSRRQVEVDDLVTAVIVDEAHRFRNPSTQRYANLCRLVGGRKVLFISATPVQNSRRDLVEVLRIALPAARLVGVEGALGGDFARGIDDDDPLFRAVEDAWVVRRTAQDARDESAGFRRRWGPGLALPGDEIVSRRDINGRTVPDELASAIGALGALVATSGREPARLLELTLLRRLASTAEAAIETLSRLRNYLIRLGEARRAGRFLERREFVSVFGEDPAAQLAQQVLPFWYAETGATAMTGEELRERVRSLETVMAALRDEPLRASRKGEELVRAVAAAPGKVLVFTEYAASAEAVAALLTRERPVLLSGRGAVVQGLGQVDQELALRIYREGDPLGGEPRRVLVATPVGSEGLNLEVARTVIHLDLPWNPARLAQREGRADRMGGAGTLEVIRFVPQPKIEERLCMEATLRRKRGLSDSGAMAPPQGGGPVGSWREALGDSSETGSRPCVEVGGSGRVEVIIDLGLWRAWAVSGYGCVSVDEIVDRIVSRETVGRLRTGEDARRALAAVRAGGEAGAAGLGAVPGWHEIFAMARAHLEMGDEIDAFVLAACRPLGRARSMARHDVLEGLGLRRRSDLRRALAALELVPDGAGCGAGPWLIVRAEGP